MMKGPGSNDKKQRERADLESQIRGWMLASLEGDKEAYQSFLNRVAGIVTAFLMNSMNPTRRSAQRVEELTQDVLVSIHQKRTTYRPDMPIMPWIYAISRYRLIDSIRHEARTPRTVGWDSDYDNIAGDPGPEAAPVLEAPELDALLAGLSSKQREVLMLAKYDDMPLADIAKKMNMSLSAVKVTVHRAIHAIRARSEGSSNDSGE